MNEPRFYKDKEGRIQVTMAKSEAMEDQLCDFCSSQERPFKTFKCRDFAAEEGVMSTGAWLACPDCAQIIDKRDRESLLQRALTKFKDSSIPRWYAEQTFRSIHAKFFQNLIENDE